MVRFLTLGLVVAVGFLPTAWADTPMRIVYPAPEGPNDVRFADIIELIQGALEVTKSVDGDYTAGPTEVSMDETRYLADLKDGTTVNVAWSSTSAQKEKDYLAIRIPVNKGLIGYRLCLTSRANLDRIAQVKTLEDLRKLTIGQGYGWGDIGVYKANGISVFQASYQSLFKKIDSNLFDLFPRGVNEIFSEYQANRPGLPNLMIEPRLLLYYPWPYYLFVSRNYPAIAKRLETGLRLMLKNGSFDRVFLKYHGADVKRANLKDRKLIVLTNPDLPADTPLDDKSLWFDPVQGK